MIAVVDYGMGNLRSVAKAVERVGGQVRIVSKPDDILDATKVILPGVGAFADAMEHLRRQDLVEPIRQVIAEDRPFLGICLGFQLLFSTGYEDGEHPGLDVLAGKVVPFDFSYVPGGEDLDIPHMGWNAIRWQDDSPLYQGLENGCYVYFVHGYHVLTGEDDLECTRTQYGYSFVSAIRRGNLMATQFHPEKSQNVGLKMIENFVNL